MAEVFPGKLGIGDRIFRKNGDMLVYHPLYEVKKSAVAGLAPVTAYKSEIGQSYGSNGLANKDPGSDHQMLRQSLQTDYKQKAEHYLRNDVDLTKSMNLKESSEPITKMSSSWIQEKPRKSTLAPQYGLSREINNNPTHTRSNIDIGVRGPTTEYSRNFDASRVTWKGNKMQDGELIEKDVYPNPNDPLSKFRPSGEFISQKGVSTIPFQQIKMEKQLDMHNDIIAGTTQKSYHLQGYSGHIPRNLNSPLVWNQALGKSAPYMSSMQDDMIYKLYALFNRQEFVKSSTNT